ncbi:MAG: NnrS family protein, partial [Gammaproteobacteria bacterium]|nr:NnrS family protein [Gammaproteobacteria bacterium]
YIPANTFSLFALGFRPFFLMAGVAAFTLISVWLLVLTGAIQNHSYYQGKFWHSHEMLFGFIVAVASGFLLTAVKNWTGIQTIRHTPLMLLTLLWLLGRIMPLASGMVPGWMIAIVDMLFLIMLAAGVAAPILRKKQITNYVFPVIILLMFIANGLCHLQFLGFTETTAMMGINLMMYLIVVLIMVMGGRVIPFFTERGVPGVTTRHWKWVEQLSIGSLVLVGLIDSIMPLTWLLFPVLLVSACTYAIRLYGWYDHRIWREPMVWILQLGYAWLVLGLFLMLLIPFKLILREYAIHALTTGGMGLIIIGMMARVALGHTGRMIKAMPSIQLAFIIAAMAPVVRVFLPLLGNEFYFKSLLISGILWCIAFLIFATIYLPILTKARVDGQPG